MPQITNKGLQVLAVGTADHSSVLDTVRDHTQPDDDVRELPDGIVSVLKPAGYFSLLLPEDLGGAQMDYPPYIDLVLETAVHDGSTAWCINQGSVLAGLARLLPADAAKEIWTNPGVVLANGPPSPGQCRSSETAEGFNLSGTWTFSSGIAHADWLLGVAAARLDSGEKAAKWYLFPKSSADIDFDWEVNGLRRTGSYGFSVEQLAVPAEHAFEYQVRKEDPPLYQIPMNLLFAGGFAAVALGVSRAAIDFAVERCRRKIKRFAQKAMQEDTATQDVIGRAEANWQAARSYLMTAVERIWQSTCREGYCPTEEKYYLRLAATHGIRQAKLVTDLVYDLCSTDSIRGHEAIQRYFQDIHVISQHLQGRPEIYSVVGSYKLGLSTSHHMVD